MNLIDSGPAITFSHPLALYRFTGNPNKIIRPVVGTSLLMYFATYSDLYFERWGNSRRPLNGTTLERIGFN